WSGNIGFILPKLIAEQQNRNHPISPSRIFIMFNAKWLKWYISQANVIGYISGSGSRIIPIFKKIMHRAYLTIGYEIKIWVGNNILPRYTRNKYAQANQYFSYQYVTH